VPITHTDAANNYYLGDCKYGNNDINYPAVNYLSAYDWQADAGASVADLATAAGYSYTGIASNVRTQVTDFISFAAASDASANVSTKRYRLRSFDSTSVNGAMRLGCQLFDNGGNVLINPTLTYAGELLATAYPYAYFNIVANSGSLSISIYVYNSARSLINAAFIFGGALVDVNNNQSGYYSGSIVNHSVSLSGSLSKPNDLLHYIGNAQQVLLDTGRAVYPIACADNQTPSSAWATDWYVFDANTNFVPAPAIGRVPNMLLGTGSYTIGKPVKILGAIQPDNGHNHWLPVGTFGGKTILQRCYSSVT
jgi:hypothetical protein